MGCCGGDKGSEYEGADYADPSYEGPPTDPNLAQGPVENRGCTDIICCLFFLGFLGFMGYMSMAGLADGKPDQLLDVYDPDGTTVLISPLYHFSQVSHAEEVSTRIIHIFTFSCPSRDSFIKEPV